MSFFDPPNYPYYDFNDVRVNPISRVNKKVDCVRRAAELYFEIYTGSNHYEFENAESVLPVWTEKELEEMKKLRQFKLLKHHFPANPADQKKKIQKVKRENMRHIARNRGPAQYGSGKMNILREYSLPDPFSDLEKLAMKLGLEDE